MFKLQKIGLLALVMIISTFGYTHATIEVGATISTNRPEFVPGEIIVKFKENKINIASKASIQQIKTFSVNSDVIVQEKIPESNIVIVKTDPGQNMDAQIAQLESNTNVEYAEPNYIYYTQSNDEYYGDLWGLEKISWPNAINAVVLPSISTTGTIVAVIDVGVDYTHPDLINNMRDGSSCKSDTGALLGGCLHGYDFIEQDLSPIPTTSTHGTHVAGVIAATMNNDIGVAGVNPYAKIMALRVGVDETSGLTSDAIIRAINFARQNGAKVINASFGGPSESTFLFQAIQNFEAEGGIFVTAAGNGFNGVGRNHDIVGNTTYPCDYNLDNIICVGSVGSGDTLSTFSDRSSTSVDVVAPGEYIKSTINQTTQLYESFETTLSGEVPNGRVKNGTGNNRWVITRADGFGKVLATNQTNPYAGNTASSIQKTINLSGADAAKIQFYAGCDTEYSTGYSNGDWKDYLSIKFSKDGIVFTEKARLNEAYIDELKGDPIDSSGTAIGNFFLNIPLFYLTSGFTVKFDWITNDVDNNYSGCFIDEVDLQKYKTGSPLYGYMNGTSMATPYIAGLASLMWNTKPSLAYQQIKDSILYSGDYITGLDGKIVSSRRINIKNTVFSLSDPEITIGILSNQQTGDTVLVGGTGSDPIKLSQILVNNLVASGTTDRSQSVNLQPGLNTIIVTGSDYAGNSTTVSIDITRIPYTYSGIYTIIDANTVKIHFNSDFVTSGFVRYGTGGLTDYVSSGEATNHTLLLSNLVPNTTYTYQTYGVYQGSTGTYSDSLSFKTPDIFDTKQGGIKTATGSIFLLGSSSTGVIFENTGSITIYSTVGDNDVAMVTSGLVISTSGNTWNGIINGPVQVSFTGITPIFANYKHIPALTFEIGSNQTSLTFTGTTGVVYPTINLGVGTVYNDKVLKIFRSDNGYPYGYISDCIVKNGVCTFTTTSFSLFTILAPDTTTTGGGGTNGLGGGGGSSNTVEPITTPITTPVIVSSGGEAVISKLSEKEELKAAYVFAYKNKITTQSSIEKADMGGPLIREHLAKMISNYAINVLGKKVDTTKSCVFEDIGGETSEIRGYIKIACQLGLMGQNTTKFDPKGEVNRGQFSTILSRLLYGSQYEGGTPYYAKHITALKTAGIIKSIDPSLKEMRGYVMLMLMRSQNVK